MSKETELFKDIPNFKDLYQISNLGNVKSLSRLRKHYAGGFARTKEKILSNCIDNNGYYLVNLTSNNKSKTHQIHKLMAITFLNHEVLECGFKKSDLWQIAAREAKNRKLILIDEILNVWIFLPFSWLWVLLPTSILVAIFIKRTLPEEWKVFNCDNCNNPVCPNCVDNDLGINLCEDCSKIIKGLSSVKVTEALLRRKRQKTIKKTTSAVWKKMLLFPGGTNIYTNRAFAGILMIFISSIAILSLAWNGFHFKDPRYEFTSFSLWKMIASLTILTIEIILSARVSNPKKTKSYNILPQEIHLEQREKENRNYTEENKSHGVKSIEAGEGNDPFGVFMDTL
jgi:hypothetical protein